MTSAKRPEPDAYYVITGYDKEAQGEDKFDPPYEKLVGPDGFECWLCEPEDRIFSRDLKQLVDLVNDQHRKLSSEPPVPRELIEWAKKRRDLWLKDRSEVDYEKEEYILMLQLEKILAEDK
jgi:hypothetical protein